ncbi:Putative ABC transporter [Acididesulfobacillus acetoxydans]|uniref:ABC transporter n=1 Tax=Acididesulfobacillus acetoxydans TaxID=1561005 RepID=A0A8S0X7D6_9FIRM|nr:ABC transporter ATP-binding protein [Acididesulfobacillus acetoxydans]CAA7603230.1 Putative ABC transporter [Acididesulfobacillus acetoxydans]
MSVIQTQELAVGYGGRTVVGDINLEALKGQFICLLGPNGSGKSTIIRTLSGLLRPLGGCVYLKGEHLNAIEPRELAKTMAVVLTERLSPGLIKVFDLVAMGRYPYTDFFGRLTGKDREKTREALGLVDAGRLADRYFNELSDGEKQKVLMARALVQEPEVLILDEPTSHLDLKHRLEVMAILRRLTQEKGITVILSLHEVDMALKSCELVILVKDGKILASGAPEEILSDERVAELYDIDCANFSNCLGGIELRNGGGAGVFVLAGGGSGALVYRLLNKQGFSLSTGVISENDIDYHVGRALGATVISEKPFEEISKSALNRAVFAGAQAAYILDAGFPLGTQNRRNLDLVKQILAQGRTIYSLRHPREARFLFGEDQDQWVFCPTTGVLLSNLKREEGRRQSKKAATSAAAAMG